jgi:hypothetical protein
MHFSTGRRRAAGETRWVRGQQGGRDGPKQMEWVAAVGGRINLGSLKLTVGDSKWVSCLGTDCWR